MYLLIDRALILFFIIYVDDLLLKENHTSKITSLERQLKSKFQMFALGLLVVYLGVFFFYKPGGIFMTHSCYISHCMEELGLSHCLPATVPLDPSVQLPQNMDSPLLSDPTYYQVIVGKLLHLNSTRLDIVYAVGVVTRFTQAPHEAHLDAAIHIMPYLKGTINLAILYLRGEKLNPSGYTDSDF